MGLPTQLLHITIPSELLAKVDHATQARYINRSEFIRQAIVDKLRMGSGTNLPVQHGFDVLTLTDVQLDELLEVARLERLRRKRHGITYEPLYSS